jgi:NAD-dependent dihydropyrimidine dehydrogenase PreA subunit
MGKRKIIKIERDLCDGCGLCTTACAEGALAIDEENKAVLVREIYCDGMGACLDVCPTGALKIIERESENYDARAAYAHIIKTRGEEAARLVHGIGEGPSQQAHPISGHKKFSFSAGCPRSAACEIPEPGEGRGGGEGRTFSAASELRQWPIQLHLVSPHAPYFKQADLLVAADCTAFALGGFHPDLLRGKKLIIACPKLDETEGYVQKLADIIVRNDLKSLTVALMAVPCCSGLWQIVQRAVEMSGLPIKLRKTVIHIDGRIIPQRPTRREP